MYRARVGACWTHQQFGLRSSNPAHIDPPERLEVTLLLQLLERLSQIHQGHRLFADLDMDSFDADT